MLHRLILPLIFLAAVSGCANYPPAVTVRLDDSLRDAGGLPFVEVHLVGEPAGAPDSIATGSVARYWQAGGASRFASPDRKVLQLGPDAPSKTIEKTDSIWDQWKRDHCTRVVILADMPASPDAMGNDPRRTVVPLDPGNYTYAPEITVSVRRSGIFVEPAPTPHGG